MDFNLQDVDCFLSCVKQGSLSLGAQALNLSVPTVVRAIRRLETEFNLVLLEPGARGARLTPVAAQFAQTAQGLSAGYAQAIQVIADMRVQKTSVFRIGFPDPGRARSMAQPLSLLLESYPDLRLKIRMGQPDRLMAQAIRDGDMDIAMMPVYESVPEGCEAVAVGSDPNLPVVRSGHPLAHRPSLALADLAPYGWSLAGQHTPITQALNAAYENAGLAPPRIAVENEFASLFSLSLVQFNDLLTIVPRSVLVLADPGTFHILPLAELRRERTIAFLTRTHATKSPLLRTFLNALVAIASK
jgi:DNA-binding transcriptional LysR family regulator